MYCCCSDAGGVAAGTQGVNVVVPSSVRFPVSCSSLSSVAELPISNMSGRWMHCNIALTRVTVDSNPLPIPPPPGTSEQANHLPVFHVKEKVMIEPGTTENVQASRLFTALLCRLSFIHRKKLIFSTSRKKLAF